jgi:hypothetical protein
MKTPVQGPQSLEMRFQRTSGHIPIDVRKRFGEDASLGPAEILGRETRITSVLVEEFEIPLLGQRIGPGAASIEKPQSD